MTGRDTGERQTTPHPVHVAVVVVSCAPYSFSASFRSDVHWLLFPLSYLYWHYDNVVSLSVACVSAVNLLFCVWLSIDVARSCVRLPVVLQVHFVGVGCTTPDAGGCADAHHLCHGCCQGQTSTVNRTPCPSNAHGTRFPSLPRCTARPCSKKTRRCR